MDLMTLFVLVAAAATAVSLFNGIASMAHGGESDARLSTGLMFRRVGWQALAVLFLLMALLSQPR